MLIEDKAVMLIADKEDVSIADDADVMGKASDDPPITVVDVSFSVYYSDFATYVGYDQLPTSKTDGHHRQTRYE